MSRFTADCSRCCGLCCFVPAYLREQGFPHYKPAEKPCRHLDGAGLCGIHARRVELGFGACGGFDCHGAGQWITQQLFNGARWQDSATTAAAMARAWRYWSPRFESAALLEAALLLVPQELRPLLKARIDEVLAATSDAVPLADPRTPRRETLAFIRALLQTAKRPAGTR